MTTMALVSYKTIIVVLTDNVKGEKEIGCVSSDEEEGYEVEQVLDRCVVRGRVEFLIKWKGFSESDNMWEPEKNLDCPELIGKFLKMYNKDKENRASSKEKQETVKQRSSIVNGKKESKTKRKKEVGHRSLPPAESAPVR
ncbi:hypothetical protein scyTo_0008507 [Scyliorhinus torazame]|uniref:Chromo domain-containing protein n=1 Tax=Scyliorhinus torazame TaxID=75743 RepID=A0A401PAK1_SCYTO|nr:hypothetical protein [Scyliorhinus torazame]